MSTLITTSNLRPIQDFTPEKQSPSFSGIVNQKITPQTVATATAVTLTYAQVLAGLILQDPSGGAVTTTLPTAALLVPKIEGSAVYSAVRFIIKNTADAAEAITVAAGTGGTTSGTMTIAQNYLKEFLLVVTAVGDTPTYTVYSLGSVAF